MRLGRVPILNSCTYTPIFKVEFNLNYVISQVSKIKTLTFKGYYKLNFIHYSLNQTKNIPQFKPENPKWFISPRFDLKIAKL